MTIFCVKWCDEVCQTLTSDPLGILQCKHCELGHTIQMMTDFPNPHTIASYLGPLTSWSNDLPGFNGIVSSCRPDVMIITRFCIQHFSWSVETLLGKMCGVWMAVAIRSFCQVTSLWVTGPSADNSFKLPQPQNNGIKFVPSDLQIITSHLKSTPASLLSVYNVAIPNASLYAATTSGISPQEPIKPLIASWCVHAMEVPACIVDHIVPIWCKALQLAIIWYRYWCPVLCKCAEFI